MADQARYPENHVVGVIDTPEALSTSLAQLTSGGFLESEVSAACGTQRAEQLARSTGHAGLVDRLVRVAQRIGVRDEEMETKDRYEKALRDGQYVVSVLAPTPERKTKAADILRQHGGHFINFLGRFTIESLTR
ncbi:MAG TPA: hypothetical protein VFW66_03600 [Gemmatimonadales bacterium]|nr:hypothetical protein [Gemmatimonadales bacterium]